MRAEIKKIKNSLAKGDLKTASGLILKANQQVKNYPVLLGLEGIYYVQLGNLEQALAAFALAAQTMPRDPALYYNIACVLRAMGRYKAAEEAIQKSLRLDPLSPMAQFEQARIKTSQGKHAEAIMTLFKCIQNASLFFPAYVALTQYLLLDNQKALAVQLYETAVAGAPNEQFFRDRLQELKTLTSP